MRFDARVLSAICLAALISLACGPKGDTVGEKRKAVMEMKDDTLAELYREYPDARAAVKRSAGYAVFDNSSSKILMLATGYGHGVAVDNRSGKNTYMRMVEAGGGVGMGIKKYKAVFVFNDRNAFDQFRDGALQAGGDADAGAQYEGKGKSAGLALTTDELTRAVTVYQFTDKGVNVSAVATGTRYYPDDELN